MKQEIENTNIHLEKNKYHEALAKYHIELNNNEIQQKVCNIIAEKTIENNTLETKKFLLGSVELTSLKSEDSDESIMTLTKRVNDFDTNFAHLPHVASICVYPNFVGAVKSMLEVEGIEITSVVGGFPSSQTYIEVKIAETALAVKDGATEIDTVLPIGKFLNGNYREMCDDISEIRQAGDAAPLKVILETGCLKTASNIKKAAILAMYAGADYIKTSTGKEKIGATPEAVYVMCCAIKEYYEETGIQVGIKVAGGINTVQEAINYYTIVKEILGEKWLTNKWFRIGTSRLANLLLSEIEGKEIKFF